MAINKSLWAVSLLAAAAGTAPPAWSREQASPSACQAAAAAPAIVAAKSARDADPGALEGYFQLADAWSDAGCFGEAVRVLQDAEDDHTGSKELETRLRVARSLVGEEHFFDNLDRATAEARLKRASFRCTNLSDLEGCTEALRLKPDDPTLLVAQGDTLLRAGRPADALSRYRLAAVIAPGQHDLAARITTAEAQLPSSAGAAASAGGVTPSHSGTPPGGGALAGGVTGLNTQADTSHARAAPTDGAHTDGAAEVARAPAMRTPGRRESFTAASAATPLLRTANVAAAATRRYSNAAPASQSH